ncbi:MAG: hypothetical protein Q7R95_00075, partial [bacterium]|nr:hypothetical protein [bacterium]
ILASGPSVAMYDISKLKNCCTMSFNRSYIAFNDWKFTPTYFVGLDSVVNYDNRKQYKKLIKSSNISRFFFSRDSRYESYLKAKNVDLVDINDMPSDPTIDFNRTLNVGNSGLFGLQIAIGILGFREIYLLGCEANYEEVVPGVTIQNGLYVSNSNTDINHFRPDYYGVGTTYNKPGSQKWHYNAWLSFYNKYFKNKLLNVKIFNLSPISKLTFFKRARFNIVTKNITSL